MNLRRVVLTRTPSRRIPGSRYFRCPPTEANPTPLTCGLGGNVSSHRRPPPGGRAPPLQPTPTDDGCAVQPDSLRPTSKGASPQDEPLISQSRLTVSRLGSAARCDVVERSGPRPAVSLWW
ncbi:hypothetical protein J2T23_004007 [Pseudarthrobacter niigatensis]|uniref:Uncharacterized protein n=1 Tax=Pseudarthrobacter niigatensis TaxID=369935 RepID=A0AAJ1WIZ1_9MICC|nr:hypothetical protein [Pseudarthrobacter niigatensis]MDQ0268124.1 hypothetical protein [Pseudarthrobacter niigatensis]